MEQNPTTPLSGSAPPADSAISLDQLSSQSEDALPAHLRASVTNVPVTPGISVDTYVAHPGVEDVAPGEEEIPSYFRGPDRDVVRSPEPEGGAETPRQEDTDPGKDILQRLSLGAMGGRRESITELRSVNPDLALSGNIISATFNIPHSLKYRPGSDWVSFFQQLGRLR